MLATYEALGDAHLMPRPSPCRSKRRWKAAVSTVVASLKFGETVGCVSEDIVSDNDDINGESLSLGEVSLSSTNFWLSAFSLVSCFSILNLQVLLASYTSFIGMQPSDGGRILSMCGVGILLSNLSLGPVADRIGSRQLLTVSFFGISVLFFIWPRCISTASLSALAFCYGYLCCTMSSLPVIILADAYESFPQRVLALNGITNIFKFPGYLFGPLIAGMLVEKKGYGFAGFVSGLTTLAGSLTLFMVPSADKQHRELLEFKRNKLSK
jgi:MFS family permease